MKSRACAHSFAHMSRSGLLYYTGGTGGKISAFAEIVRIVPLRLGRGGWNAQARAICPRRRRVGMGRKSISVIERIGDRRRLTST